MSEEKKSRKRGNLAKLHLFSSKAKLKNKGKVDHQENGFHFEKEVLLKEKEAEERDFTQLTEKKHNFTESIKNARKTLIPQLGSANRHHKIPRQSTIDIGDLKSVGKVHQSTNKKPEVELDKSSNDMKETRNKAGRQSLQHLDLAELTHRRTATCEELEKFTIDNTGTKTLYNMRKDLLTFQRLREWSFL